jgi:hypothetical protein
LDKQLTEEGMFLPLPIFPGLAYLAMVRLHNALHYITVTMTAQLWGLVSYSQID